MKKSSISLSILSALAAAGMSAAAATGIVDRSAPVRRSYRGSMSRVHHRPSGYRYPEQSTRQALRGQRRAQGGPGLVLIDGVEWAARA